MHYKITLKHISLTITDKSDWNIYDIQIRMFTYVYTALKKHCQNSDSKECKALRTTFVCMSVIFYRE